MSKQTYAEDGVVESYVLLCESSLPNCHVLASCFGYVLLTHAWSSSECAGVTSIIHLIKLWAFVALLRTIVVACKGLSDLWCQLDHLFAFGAFSIHNLSTTILNQQTMYHYFLCLNNQNTASHDWLVQCKTSVQVDYCLWCQLKIWLVLLLFCRNCGHCFVRFNFVRFNPFFNSLYLNAGDRFVLFHCWWPSASGWVTWCLHDIAFVQNLLLTESVFGSN